MKLAGLLMFISDVHALGLQVAHGLVVSNTFYWDHDERTRAFTERLIAKTNNVYPGMAQAGAVPGRSTMSSLRQHIVQHPDDRRLIEIPCSPLQNYLICRGEQWSPTGSVAGSS